MNYNHDDIQRMLNEERRKGEEHARANLMAYEQSKEWRELQEYRRIEAQRAADHREAQQKFWAANERYWSRLMFWGIVGVLCTAILAIASPFLSALAVP